MPVPALIQDSLDAQFQANRNRSLFYRGAVRPTQRLKTLLTQQHAEVEGFLEGLDASEGQALCEQLADASLKEFMQANQYLDFRARDRQTLADAYARLLEAIARPLEPAEVDAHMDAHYSRLRDFLIRTNGEAVFALYRQSPELPVVPCAEYRAELQLDLLGLTLDTLREPVLDLGCGPSATLVTYLRAQGVEAFGLDRLGGSAPHLWRGNWLEAEFAPRTWGTVVSHMAFSNHFWHHALRSDGALEAYARKFQEILNSLRDGGRFVYAPGLPDVEAVLVETGACHLRRLPLPPARRTGLQDRRFYAAHLTPRS